MIGSTSPAGPQGWQWIEFDQEPGSLVFVPEGWWHLVLNEELSVAITHNFITPFTFAKGLRASMDNDDHDFACAMWERLPEDARGAVAPWVDEKTQHALAGAAAAGASAGAP